MTQRPWSLANSPSVGVLTDPTTGLPLAGYHRGQVVPTTDATAQTVADALQRRGCASTVAHGCVRLDGAVDPAELLGEGDAAAATAGWGLDHVLTTAEMLGGNPFGVGHGTPGLDHYGEPDRSRGPVNVLLPAPRPTTAHRPRIVVLDTGVGEHPWLDAAHVEHEIRFADGTKAGPFFEPGAEPEGAGMVPRALLGALGSHVGHGTFIAGLLRQSCPDAVVVAPGIMGADGMVAESTLIAAVEAVLRRVQEDPQWAVAVVLSLGYYTEEVEDLVYTSRLRRVLLDLGKAGVAVFCAAGNDATRRPSFPAAFAVDRAWAEPDVVPLVSVAALDADGSTAEFSNDGDWVTAAARGVNLVSTVPTTADGSVVPHRSVIGPSGRRRSTTDFDDFSSGFASWSGTSFAAPVLAGQYVRALLAQDLPTSPRLRRSLLATFTRSTAAVG